MLWSLIIFTKVSKEIGSIKLPHL